MEANPSPQSGINAWLEEELLQQYHHDRASVDADWKNVFEHDAPNGSVVRSRPDTGQTNGDIGAKVTAPTVILHSAAVEPVLTGSEELMPLRGAPARIAEKAA